MEAELKNFVFRGMLGSHTARELESRGLLRPRSLPFEEKAEHDLYAQVPEVIRNASVPMQKIYRSLFTLENMIREFIGNRLSEDNAAGDWFESHATSDMKTKVQKRKDQEAKNQWHSGRNDHPIFYLDFGDLGLLIINHWEKFKDFFPSQPWVTSRMQEAERTRSVIAHTGTLPMEEGDRLQMYLKDFLAQIF